jgi:ParB family transcriptional regulator, chromosome partitioning protein
MDNKEIDVKWLKIKDIIPNPNQPRRIFDQEALNELSKSIEVYGVMQPITVRCMDNGYELIAGERRLRASMLLNLESIPAIIIEANHEQSSMIALIENLQRENLNFYEEALGFQKLIQDYSISQKDLAVKLGKSQSTIANKIRLLSLPPTVLTILTKHQLTERHGRALLSLETEKLQLSILQSVIKENLNVKQTEDKIQKLLNKRKLPEIKKSKTEIKGSFKDIRLFTNTIKQAVDMMKGSGIEIYYEVSEQNGIYHINIDIPMNKVKDGNHDRS